MRDGPEVVEETRRLAGRRVLVTRAPELAGPWVEALESRGATVASRAVFTLEPMIDEPGVQRSIDRIQDWDWILLTSRSGLRFLVQALAARAIRLRDVDARIGVVGPRTAAALEDHGRTPDAVAVPPDGAGLAATLEGRVHPGQRVLIVRPDETRKGLAERLEEYGAQVHSVPFYRNRAAEHLAGVASELTGGSYDAIVFGSPSAFLRLREAWGERAAHDLAGIALVAIGGTTAEAIRGGDFRVAAIASEPTPEGIADAVEVALLP